jgi:hypothetical protein
MSTPMPMIRLEVEGMRQTVVTALTARQLELDEYVRNALDVVCSPDNVQRIVQAAAEDAIQKAVAEEVAHFFRYGNGREAIKQAVSAVLDRDCTERR